jgi:uncharacterized membrane protein
MPSKMAEKALQESRSFGMRRIPLLRPLGWLAKGWRDLMRCPLPGLLHGVALAAFGALLIAVAWNRFWLLAGAFSGFLLVGPIAATGLYAISRQLSRGEAANLGTALAAWKPRDGRLIVFGLLLAFAGTGWVMTSASLITGFAPAPVLRPVDFLRVVVLAPEGLLFEAWLAVGALLAAPVFASSVVAIPLLLDRQIGVLGAVFTSWRVVSGPADGPDLAGHGDRPARSGCGGALAFACQLARLPGPGRHPRPGGAPLMLGYSEEQIAWFGLTFGVTAFMIYMVFIILQLARESKAGRFGTFVLLLGLGVGLIGFAAKGLIKYFMAGIVE